MPTAGARCQPRSSALHNFSALTFHRVWNQEPESEPNSNTRASLCWKGCWIYGTRAGQPEKSLKQELSCTKSPVCRHRAGPLARRWGNHCSLLPITSCLRKRALSSPNAKVKISRTLTQVCIPTEIKYKWTTMKIHHPNEPFFSYLQRGKKKAKSWVLSKGAITTRAHLQNSCRRGTFLKIYHCRTQLAALPYLQKQKCIGEGRALHDCGSPLKEVEVFYFPST